VKWIKALGALALLLVVLGVVGWTFRLQILLRAPGIVMRLTDPIGPHRDIAWSPGPERAEAPPGQRPPNIVLILADDLGFNDVALHGGAAGGSVPTPHIDSIARQGVRFENGYAGNAVCAPSRAMILTGRYSTRFGFEYTPAPKGMALLAPMLSRPGRLRRAEVDREAARSMPAFGEMGMSSDEVTIAEALRARGYRTLHVGKWHLGRTQGFRPRDQGFDESLLMYSGKYLPDDHPDAVNSKQDFDPIDAFLWPNLRFGVSFNDGEAFEPDLYLTDYFTEQSVAAIQANRNRPFFLYLAHWAPHTPLQALRADYDALAHIQDHTLRVYAAMIRSLDRSVGRILSALEEQGLSENTLVVFTSDNGGAGYIGLPDINRPYRGWKLTLFEGGTHVPFFARWPARIPAGARFAAPVSHLDLFTTFAAAAGAAIPDDRPIDGVDLLPHLRGEAPDTPHPVLFWREGYYRSVLADGWKLQVSQRPDKEWLYDLGSDPTEQHNLAAAHPERVAALRAKLEAHAAEQAPPAWPSIVQVPISIDKTLAEAESPTDEYIYWPN
jgi:uncharacterized sulfatase